MVNVAIKKNGIVVIGDSFFVPSRLIFRKSEWFVFTKARWQKEFSNVKFKIIYK